MAKICIARRRLENSALQGLSDAEIRARDNLTFDQMDEMNLPPTDEAGPDQREAPQGQAGQDTISIALSEQREKALEGLLSHPELKEATGQTYWVDVKKKDANLIFNFYPMKSRIRMISAKEISDILGVSTSKVYQLVKTGQLKSYKVGRAIRVNFEHMLDYLSGAEATLRGL